MHTIPSLHNSRTSRTNAFICVMLILLSCIGFISLPTITVSAAPTKLKSWITDGYVTSSALSGNTIYLGGQFRYVGPPNKGFAAFDQATHAADVTFPSVSGDVYAIASDQAGGWYIGGHFIAVDGVPRASLAHVRADHTLDLNWKPDVGNGSTIGDVLAIAAVGNTVYVGGAFATIGGQPRTSLAALDATTGAATSWSPHISGGVLTLAVSATTVYIGGNFSSVDGQPRNRLAAFDAATGALTSWNPDASEMVRALVISGNTVYIGGHFTSISKQQRSYIAAVDAVTGIPTDWNPQIQGFRILTLALQGSTLYIGGDFSKVNNLPRNNLAALEIATGSVTAWDPGVTYSTSLILAIAASGTTVYVGGVFTTLDGSKKTPLIALQAGTGSLVDWDVVALKPYNGAESLLSAGAVDALAMSDSQLYVGGEFASIGGVKRNNIAALDATTGVVTSWNPNANDTVHALLISETNIYAGGDFTSIGGVTRNHLAALDVTTAVPTSWDPNTNGAVRTLLAADNLIYVGGTFTTVSGQPRSGLAAMDAVTGALTDWNPEVEGGSPNLVSAMAMHERTLYIGGSFTSVGGQSRNHLAALDAPTGVATNWHPDANNTVLALIVQGDTIYAGGAFTVTNDIQRNHLAAFDIHNGALNDWNPDADDSVYALAANGTTIYAGGLFTTINGQEHYYIAALDSTNGIPTTWNPQLNAHHDMGFFGFVATLIVKEPVIYIGGGFSTINGQYYQSFAIFKDVEPTVRTNGASAITSTAATLAATVNPQGLDTTAAFQYTTASGDYSQAPSIPSDPSSLNGAIDTDISANLTGFTPNTTYYYRVVATNSVGTSYGNERSFTTSALPTTSIPPSILSQPSSQTIAPGQTATLGVNVSGTALLRYQWYEGESGDTHRPIIGAINSSYTTPPLSHTTSYWVRIANAAGTIDSATTIISVVAQPSHIVFIYLPVVRR